MTTTTARPCANCGHAQPRHGTLAGCTAALDAGGYCPCDRYQAPTTDDTPVTPYDGGTSSGHSGSATSAARSARRDTNGQTQQVQEGVLNLVTASGHHGQTIVEVRRAYPGDHHGTLSGALSNLHHKGLVARLAETRERAQVYVTPDKVDGRQTVPHGRRTVKGRGRLTAEEAAAAQRVRAILPEDPEPGARMAVGVATMTVLLDALDRLS